MNYWARPPPTAGIGSRAGGAEAVARCRSADSGSRAEPPLDGVLGGQGCWQPASGEGKLRGVDLRPWPDDFRRKKAGEGCPQCELGRVDETEHGVRFFEGQVADGYLQRRGPTPGYSVVIFRGRHVAEPHSMTREEHGAFWSEVSAVAAAIGEVYAPIHLNTEEANSAARGLYDQLGGTLAADGRPTVTYWFDLSFAAAPKPSS